MKRLTLFFLLSSSGIALGSHQEKGTFHGISGVKIYEQMKHGPDGSIFLDPSISKQLESLEGKTVLDAGCGAGPWSIVCAENGAEVYGIDIQEGMIKKAKAVIAGRGLHKKVQLTVGSVDHLPYSRDAFDMAISINVGCNLPISQEVFDRHFSEMQRTLKKDGAVFVTAPACFDTIFTNGTDPVLIHRRVKEALDIIGSSTDSKLISETLGQLHDIYRATFAFRNNHLSLITDEQKLIEGEPIWRKIPGQVVPNYYHSEQAYLEAAEKAGLKLSSVERPKFDSLEEWDLFKESLGKEYALAYPFVIFHFAKESTVK